MRFNLWSWLGLFANIFTIGITLAVLIVMAGIGRRHRGNRSFALFLFFLFGWIFSGQFTQVLLWLGQGDPRTGLYTTAAFFFYQALALFHFAGRLVGLRRPWFRLSVGTGTVLGLASLIPLVTHQIITAPSLSPTGLLRWDTHPLGYGLVAVAFAYLIVTPLILLIRRYRVPHPMVTIGTLIIAGSEVIGLTGSLFAIPFPLLTMGVAAGISILGISMVHYQLLKPLRDTTRKLEARQADLKERNRRLEEANSKLQELDEWKEKMTHMVIHDVKSPLNVINVVLTDFRNNLSAGMDSTQQQLLQSALISAHRVQSLVSSMLDVRRLEEGRLPIKPVPFDLRSIIDDSLQALNPLLTLHDISVDVHFSTPIPMADGDPDVIARVIENLVDNAAKFSPSPGTVAIELSAETDELRFSISDCGPGIPPAYQERVFEKFFRITSEAQDTRSGVGLGLAFCKLALEAQGGYIWVESDGHSGTAFHFSLPAWQEPAGNPNPVSGTVSHRND